MANNNLTNAKRAKNDEFYTQYGDIQKEIEAYLEFNPDVFRGKAVYCNCDDPYESNFFRYFVLNFKKLRLKQLITTSYKPSPVANTQLSLFGDDKTIAPIKGRPKITANKFIISDVGDIDGDGEYNLKDIAKQLKANKHNEWTPLNGEGDFRSPECVELLKKSDIVVTNPPFSLFREYVKQLFDYDKKFVIIGNKNSVTYKEIKGKKAYDKYDNYDAIEVPFTDAIPSDYAGVMGVPISFLDKYNPEQFEIIGWSRHNDCNMDGGYWKGGKNDATINGKDVYRRILIRHKKVKKR